MTFIKKSEDGKVTFEEQEHKYLIGNEQLTSVTTLLKNYFEPFDAKRISKLKADNAKRRNYKKYKNKEELTELDKKEATQKYWRQQWTEAAEHGSRCHLALENYINEIPQVGVLKEERDYKKYEQGIKALDWIFKTHFKAKDVKHYTEVLIYNEELMLAGQVDLLSKVDGNFYVLDWKTSKKIDMEGYKGKKGTHPITKHLQSCEYIKYSLQLGVYKKMLQLDGKEIKKCYIIHLMEDDFEIYETKELYEELEAIFHERKEQLIDNKMKDVSAKKQRFSF